MKIRIPAPVGQPMKFHAAVSDCPRNWRDLIIPQQDSRWSYPAGLIYGVLSGAAMLFFFDVLPGMLR